MTLAGDGQMTLRGQTGDIGGNGQVTLTGQTADFRVDRQMTLRRKDMFHLGWTNR